jgi:hypothetical protein
VLASLLCIFSASTLQLIFLFSVCLPVFFCSVVDRHRFDIDRDRDPTFHFDADPHSDPTPSFTFLPSNASLQRFSFLIRGKCVMIFGQHIEIFMKKVKTYMCLVRSDTHREPANDADPTLSGIHNTAFLTLPTA